MEFVKDCGITKPKGFKASGIHCGLRKNKVKNDLGLIYSENICKVSAVYTTNIVFGAPITITREHLLKNNNKSRAIIVNSGNANTCNKDGYEKAKLMTKLIANELKINVEEVLVASTGVIGQPLDITPIEKNTTKLVEMLSENAGKDVAESIMTTDTIIKEFAVTFLMEGHDVNIGLIAKGSGMINPNMATLLSFLSTDINISQNLLDKAFKEAINYTFNRVSVDGDTSTNDMVIIMANGLAKNDEINKIDKNYNIFLEALKAIMLKASKLIAQDGEGATKLIECQVNNFKTEIEAVKLAKSVIMSNLVKSAFFGNDANWGRILCALGYSGVIFDPNLIEVNLISHGGKVLVCKDGGSVKFDEDKALEILNQKEVIVEINMNQGNEKAFALGCDLTYDYVKINGSYRT